MLGLVAVPVSRADVIGRLYRVTTVDPTDIDDADDGYRVGSRWVNTLTGVEFWCADPTPDGAVWNEGGGGGSSDPLTLGGDLGGTTAAAWVKTVRGLSSALAYDVDGRLDTVTTAAGSKTMSYNPDGTLASITGTGIYVSKTFAYEDGALTGVAVS